ncbi:MAG: transposase [Ignavibacteriae bacterium]|nr:MAG: transposase [Ignavibacteriota bacterium]
MDNHLHLIVYSDNLSNIMKDFKRHTANKILLQLKEDKKEWLINQFHFYKKAHKTESEHQIWQEGFHPQIIYTDYIFKQKVDYIHMNPVRKGYVTEPQHWRYSSARYYIQQLDCEIKVDEMEW